MAVTIHLDIVSAEKEIFSGIVELVVATGLMGEIGVVYGHAPLLTQLKPGEVRVTLPGGKVDDQKVFHKCPPSQGVYAIAAIFAHVIQRPRWQAEGYSWIGLSWVR